MIHLAIRVIRPCLIRQLDFLIRLEHITTVYRPPNTPSFWLKTFQAYDSKCYTICPDLTILGDFNINLFLPHQSWQQLTASLHLSQLIKSPTRVQAKSSTLIDHIHASQEHHVVKSGVLDVGLSDHCLIFMVRKTGQTKHGTLPSRHQIRCCKWNSQNLKDLTTELAMTSWNHIYLAPAVDDMLSKFLTKLKSILHRHVKIK